MLKKKQKNNNFKIHIGQAGHPILFELFIIMDFNAITS